MNAARSQPARAAEEGLVARSPAMRRMIELLDRVAASDALVRIHGESGSGKGYVARLLHARSDRARGPFVEISCANVPEPLFESELFGYERGAHTGADDVRPGRLERAAGGTVLFDGIEELSHASQAKLLRVLQERSFERLGGGDTIRLDARVLAACTGDLEESVRRGTFRPDLFYRMDVMRIEIPPLRERREDIQRLATLFLREFREVHRRPMRVLTPEARKRLDRHPWPGNVRELRNVMEHAVLTSDGREVGPGQLRLGSVSTAEMLDRAAESRRSLAEVEAAYIERVLRETGGNRTRAAEILGISRKTLLEKRKKYGLD